MPTSSGLPRSHASDENKGRGRVAGKVRNRAAQLHMRSVNADENPTHPGKAVNVPLSTPRKALSLIDANSRTLTVPLATPSQKGGLLPQTSNKKSERKRVPLGSAVKPKQNCTQLRGKRTVKNDAAVKDKASEEESEIFPDIEVMSTRQEQGELDSDRLFVPPAYFDNLTAALKQTPLPPIGELPDTTALSSLKLELETALRPSSLNTGPPVLYPLGELLYGEDLILSVDLPDLDHL